MHPIIRNILAVVAGVFVGSIVNILLVSLGPLVVPLPEGVDVSSMESLAENMSSMKPLNFLFPFLGHALGTLVGALLTGYLATNSKMYYAIGIGVWFLFGGLTAVMMLGGPLWFNLADLVLAYLPMGYLAGTIVTRGKSDQQGTSTQE